MFRVDDEYLNGYSKLCGVNATLVYLCLCRHADRNQESFPSITSMAEKIGISPRSVITGIKMLIDWNIISKQRERKKDAKWLNNRYVLLDKSIWKPKPSSCERHVSNDEQPSATGAHGSNDSQVQMTTEPSANDDKSQVQLVHTKDTHIKDTHIEGYTSSLQSDALQEVNKDKVNELLDVFHSKGILQSFANKTHRQSAHDLIAKYGIDGAKKLAEYAISILGQEYAPTINNPYELKSKLGSLNAFLKKSKKKNSNYIKI